jgi:hypothetical protein
VSVGMSQKCQKQSYAGRNISKDIRLVAVSGTC